MSQQQRSTPPLVTAPVRRSRSAHDTALQAIGMAIVRGDYPIGSILPSKEDLMAWLDLSHTTLREALQTLAAKGMIAAKAKVGTRVLDESQWNMFDADILGWRLAVGIPASFLAMLFEIRQSIEPVAAALAAARRSEQDVARLRRTADALGAATSDRATFVAADVAFHQALLESSGNPFMHSLGALISTALSASFTLSAPTERPELSKLVHRQHMAVVEAIEARDPQRASDALITVIKQGWKNYTGSGSAALVHLEIATFKTAEPAPRTRGR